MYLGKFEVKSTDPIAMALLATADTMAAFKVFVCRAVPLIVILLVVVILTQIEEYPGVDFIPQASSLELSIG